MRIKLVMSPRSFLNEVKGMISIPPMGIARIASFIRQQGYEIDLDDLDIKVINDKELFDKLFELQKNYNQNDLNEYLISDKSNPYLDKITNLLIEKLDYKGYDIFGFSIIETSAIDSTLLLAKKIKQETNAVIVLGGFCAKPSFKEDYKFIDYVIQGEGEIALLDIINRVENKASLAGTFADPKHSLDFEGLPLSCYKNMPENGQFSNYGKILILPYIWSWGCPYKCAFCGNSINPQKVHLKTVEQTTNELVELSKKYTRFFFILNEYVHADLEHTKDLCQEIIKRNLELTWCGSARCDIDNSMLPHLHKAGCKYLYFGLESGSDNMLKRMRKGYTNKTAEKTIQKAYKSNIWTNITIIVGFPQETKEEFEETFDFVNRNQQYICQLAVSPYFLINSVITREPEKYGIRISSVAGPDRNTSRDILSYDEINGPSWEDLKKTKQKRLNKLLKLLYLYKHLPEQFLRSSTYDLLYALDRFRNNKKTYNFLKKLYQKKLSKEEPVINITSSCNNNCQFCKKPRIKTLSYEKVAKRIEKAKKNSAHTVVLSGGEPTIHKDIIEIVKYAKSQGLEVKLKTNARMLSIRNFCERLYQAGADVIAVKVYSQEPETHDKITNTPKSFRQTIQGINNWKDLGGNVEVNTVLFEENKKDISRFIDFILSLETRPTF